MSGVVEGIFVRPRGAGETASVPSVAVSPEGVEGDRYRNGTGTFFKRGKSGQALTLIEAEALEGLEADTGIVLAPEAAGRNIMTRGVDLNALVGRRFRVGGVECRGDRLCDPCRPLERATQNGVLRGLANRGGLRADVLEAGEIRVGDAVET